MLKRKVFLLLLACLFMFPSLANAKRQTEQQVTHALSPHVPHQIVVKLVNNKILSKVNKKFGTQLIDTILANENIYLLHTDRDAATLAAEMVKDGRVKYAELNYILDAPVANPMGEWAWGSGDLTIATEANPMGEWAWGGSATAGLTQYATEMINLSVAHDLSLGEGVTVAVLDTGVQAEHPYLTGYVTDGYDFVDDDGEAADTFDFIDNDGDGLVDEAAGHGTHVAGIIHTTAPAAQIMPVRVLDSDGRGNIFVIAEAICYAIFNGADVINLSLGSTIDSQVMIDILDFAQVRKVVVVAAAGNLNSDMPQYPAAYDNVLAVAAAAPDGTKMLGSNYGSWVDLAAPGLSIYSSFPTDAYAWWSGTSMATPFVAGSAALIISDAPGIRSAAVAEQLVESAEQTPTMTLLDAANALR